MSNSLLSSGDVSPKKFFIFSLLISVFAVNVIDVFVPLLLPEIAATFGIAVGTAASLSAFSATAGVITGLGLSAFSLRFRYKTILIAGVACVAVCVLGVFLAPNFLFAQIFYALNGVGSVTVGVMAATLIGELYPQERKALRMSWLMVMATLATSIGYPVIGAIADSGGITSWRNGLRWFMIPVTAICAVLVILFVPSKPLSSQLAAKREPFLNGYRQVLSNKSASACLASLFLAYAWYGIGTFQLAFLKDVFELSPAFRGLIAVVGGLILAGGMFMGGVLMNKVGRKRLLVIGAPPAILLLVGSFVASNFMANIWIVISLRFASNLIGGMPVAAHYVLPLDQVPKFRGTMMSLSSAIGGIGSVAGVLAGGALLNNLTNNAIGYTIVAATLGALGIASTLVVLFFVEDPSFPSIKSQPNQPFNG
jgi:predicted MFS family arabinose efflux permease